MKRRSFIKHSALASTAMMAPAFLQSFPPARRYASRAGKVLVVVQFSGGNDGLNTVIPYSNDLYYNLRPNLAVPSAEVLRMNDELALNPAMTDLKSLYDDGLLGVLGNVGYPNPDRSHFRSMDIWHTGSSSDEYWQSGWLGRYLDSECAGCERPYHALELDDGLSLALKGEHRSGFAMSSPEQLRKNTDGALLKALAKYEEVHNHDNESAAYLYKTLVDTQASADYLVEQAGMGRAEGDYPPTAFGQDLRQIAGLILADTDTRIFYVSLTGFDTHANQKGRQERLLEQYAQGMKAFVSDMKSNGLLNDVLVMTFSEFGRRARENGSRGTDHGTANNIFLLGGGLKQAGCYSKGPDLANLDNDDLVYQTDFRQVYAEILNKWLEADPVSILKHRFDPLGLL